eukprot:7041131-Prymnesium_polylepis.1
MACLASPPTLTPSRTARARAPGGSRQVHMASAAALQSVTVAGATTSDVSLSSLTSGQIELLSSEGEP